MDLPFRTTNHETAVSRSAAIIIGIIGIIGIDWTGSEACVRQTEAGR
jgi:hypothetical protein